MLRDDSYKAHYGVKPVWVQLYLQMATKRKEKKHFLLNLSKCSCYSTGYIFSMLENCRKIRDVIQARVTVPQNSVNGLTQVLFNKGDNREPVRRVLPKLEINMYLSSCSVLFHSLTFPLLSLRWSCSVGGSQTHQCLKSLMDSFLQRKAFISWNKYISDEFKKKVSFLWFH